MTYRRPSESGPFTSRWRLRNRARLLAVGFPASVVESDRTLHYVLLHGDDELGSGWTPDWLSEDQARDMLRFLSENIPNETGLEIFGVIRRRLAAPTGSDPDPDHQFGVTPEMRRLWRDLHDERSK